MKRLTERWCAGGIRIKGCSTLYPDQERKSAPMASAISRLAAYEDAMPLDLAQELAQAEQDRRLVVLPCKVGDIVYDILDGTPYATRVVSFSYFGDHWACWTVSSYPDLAQFGTRIFLTREEAEAALKRGRTQNETW